MLDVTRKTIILEPHEIIELERIVTDDDQEGAYYFLKKNVYRKLGASQQKHSRSPLSGCVGPITATACSLTTK